jgi:hypothetical protein
MSARHLHLVPTPVDPAEVYRRCAPLADADLTDLDDAVYAELVAELQAALLVAERAERLAERLRP